MTSLALHTISTALGQVSFRRMSRIAGETTRVCLHGIGGGAASWAAQVAAAERAGVALLAWDAPGYGRSTPLASAEPNGHDFATAFWAWLDALEIRGPVDVIAQSLGCIHAAAAAQLQPSRVAALTLLAPALGYGKSAPKVREEKKNARIESVNHHGMAGLALKRSAALLSPHATASHIEAVRETMAAIPAAGYVQATHCLANSDLRTLLRGLSMPITIAAGRSDTITPYAECKALAQELSALFITLDDAGHLAPVEAPGIVNALIGLPS